ncbi:MAG: hypothetical protein ACFFE8_12430 [Candidatus Heimdallarchaeota archaeon]
MVKLTRYALCVGYLPVLHYSGFSGQIHDSDNILTKVRVALEKARMPPSVQFASRTDRGVGAIHQVITFDTTRPPILSEVNAYLPKDIRVLGTTPVPLSFDPRRDASLRTYSYFFNTEINNAVIKLQPILQNFQGHHNFQNFAKKDPKRPHVNFSRTIEKIEMKMVTNSVYQIRLVAKSFLWQQVRRIVGFLIELINGQRNDTEIHALLNPESSPIHPSIKKPAPSPAEYLVLEYIQYPHIQFHYDEKSVQDFRNTLINHLISARSKAALFQFTLDTIGALISHNPK